MKGSSGVHGSDADLIILIHDALIPRQLHDVKSAYFFIDLSHLFSAAFIPFLLA